MVVYFFCSIGRLHRCQVVSEQHHSAPTQAFSPSPYAGNGYGGRLQDSANGYSPQGGYAAPTAPSHPANGFDGYEAGPAGSGPGAAPHQRPSWPAAPAQQNGSYARFKVCAMPLETCQAEAACQVSNQSAISHLDGLLWAGQHPHTCRSMQSPSHLATEAVDLPARRRSLDRRTWSGIIQHHQHKHRTDFRPGTNRSTCCSRVFVQRRCAHHSF